MILRMQDERRAVSAGIRRNLAKRTAAREEVRRFEAERGPVRRPAKGGAR